MSKTALKSINHSIFQLIKCHQTALSYEKRYSTTSRLTTIAKDLHRLGYIVRHINGLKPKHIQALINHWKTKALAVGTIKNRLSDLRFVSNALGKHHLVKDNAAYRIGSRCYVATQNRALVDPDFSKIQDKHLKLSLDLQRAFGLRREECIKLIPHLADKGDHLWLKGSWTKGKVERIVPIRTKAQRKALNQAKAFVQKGKSLIPPQNLTFNNVTNTIEKFAN